MADINNRNIKDMDTVFDHDAPEQEKVVEEFAENKVEYADDNVRDTTEVGDYTADNIQVLEGLEAVRKRPGMYIGTTSSRGLHHLVYEIVDNSVDEALAGFCTHIEVFIHPDNSITVQDNGRGIPVGINQKTGKNAVEVVFVVNALSKSLEVKVKQSGHIYRQKYERGISVTGLDIIGDCDEKDTGTSVHFLPDPEIFQETLIFDYDILKQRLREMAFLTKGLRITLYDYRREEGQEGDPEEPSRKHTFYYEGGIKEFVAYLNRSKNALYDEIMYFEGTKNNVYVEVAIQHNDSYQENTYGSYVQYKRN